MTSDCTRRAFLKTMALGVVAMSLPGCATRRRDPRPDIVLILADDHRHDAMSCAGHAWIRTPHLDRLAAQGARCQNAFVTTSLCSPSRASLLTGTYAHIHGVTANEATDLPRQVPTFAEVLQRAGYNTAYLGKWHQARWSTPRPGFDHWVSFNGQGRYDRNTLNVNGDWVLSDDHITDVLTDYALAFLRRPHDGPRLLVLGHKAVHGPCIPAPRHAELYDDVRFAAPGPTGPRPSWAGPPSNPDDPEILRAYARTLAGVDESTGRLLDAVGGQAVVVYAGDNGLMFGEHGGLRDKRAAYDASIRIPLLLRLPDQVAAGTVSTDLVLNIDVAPTLLAAAGISPPDLMQGTDLAQLLTGAAGRDSFLYEYFQEAGPVPTTVAVRTHRHKLITYPCNPEFGPELYDLAADPDENRNLVNDPAQVPQIADLEGELERLQVITRFAMVSNPPGR